MCGPRLFPLIPRLFACIACNNPLGRLWNRSNPSLLAHNANPHRKSRVLPFAPVLRALYCNIIIRRYPPTTVAEPLQQRARRHTVCLDGQYLWIGARGHTMTTPPTLWGRMQSPTILYCGCAVYILYTRTRGTPTAHSAYTHVHKSCRGRAAGMRNKQTKQQSPRG